MQRVDEAREPALQRLPLSALFRPDPVRQLCDDYGAGVAPVLFRFEPADDLGVALALGGLADDVGVEQPAHSF